MRGCCDLAVPKPALHKRGGWPPILQLLPVDLAQLAPGRPGESVAKRLLVPVMAKPDLKYSVGARDLQGECLVIPKNKFEAKALRILIYFARHFAAFAVLAGGVANAQTDNDTWFAFAYNTQRVATAWAQLKSYESLNSDSFRLNAKFTRNRGGQVVGKMDINCRNKDFYFRPNGILSQAAPWASIPQGSGLGSLAEYFCRRTAAKEEWGYKRETQRLWDNISPSEEPSNATGNWVQASNTDESEVYYNDKVIKGEGFIQAALWVRAKKGDRSAANPIDTQQYNWINVDCKSNIYSTFVQFDKSIEGAWLSPEPGRPGGAAMQIRKLFCK